MKTMKVLLAVILTALELTGVVDSTEVTNYENGAYEYFVELSDYVNNESTVSYEKREELKENGIDISSVDIYYGPHKIYDDGIYVFRVDVAINDHIISEVGVMDIKNDELIDNYGLYDSQPITDEQLRYYRKLLKIQ